MPKPKSNQLIDRQRLLDEFGIVTEADVARLLNIDVKTLRNRPLSQKPKFTKIGAKRVTTRQWVRDYLDGNVVEATPRAKPSRRQHAEARAAGERTTTPA